MHIPSPIRNGWTEVLNSLGGGRKEEQTTVTF